MYDTVIRSCEHALIESTSATTLKHVSDQETGPLSSRRCRCRLCSSVQLWHTLECCRSSVARSLQAATHCVHTAGKTCCMQERKHATRMAGCLTSFPLMVRLLRPLLLDLSGLWHYAWFSRVPRSRVPNGSCSGLRTYSTAAARHEHPGVCDLFRCFVLFVSLDMSATLGNISAVGGPGSGTYARYLDRIRYQCTSRRSFRK
jgi:hypothetical protein